MFNKILEDFYKSAGWRQKKKSRRQASGYDVLVKNELLGEALQALPEKKRDIILLSYFLDMSDEEIGGLLNVVRSTIFRHRKTALEKIKLLCIAINSNKS